MDLGEVRSRRECLCPRTFVATLLLRRAGTFHAKPGQDMTGLRVWGW